MYSRGASSSDDSDRERGAARDPLDVGRVKAPLPHDESLLEACNISRRLESDLSWLLHEVSCRLLPGDRVAVTGPSGGGKTVLLRGLVWLDPLSTGHLLWKGAPLLGRDTPNFRRQVIYLHQKPMLLDGTVEHNLRQPYSLQMHHGTTFDRQRTITRLEQMGRQADFLDLPTRTLSGGELQIVAVLRAVQLEPVVLLLDEPTAALDDHGTRAVEQTVLSWQAENPTQRAFIWVTHDAQQARRVATRFWDVDRGYLKERPSEP